MTAIPDRTRVAEVLLGYFAAKNRASLDETMSFVSPALVAYADSTLGWSLDGFDQLRSVFVQYMPGWSGGSSLPIRILGDESSAAVEFVDTEELFGGELHLLGAVDLEDGQIIRWVDFWDSTLFDPELLVRISTPTEAFPDEPAPLEERAAPEVAAVARRLHHALQETDLVALAQLFTRHVTYEDMALRSRVVGRDTVLRTLGETLAHAPYGTTSVFRRAVGGGSGGGYEWRGTGESFVRYGLTAFELDEEGLIGRLSIVCDGVRLPEATRRLLDR